MPVRDQFITDDEFQKALRDWFAGQALNGLLSDSDERPEKDETLEDFAESIATGAYQMADAMLKARGE